MWLPHSESTVKTIGKKHLLLLGGSALRFLWIGLLALVVRLLFLEIKWMP